MGADKILSINEKKVALDGPDKEKSTFLKIELERIIENKPVKVLVLWHPVLFEECVTEKVSDATEMREGRVMVVRNRILDIMLRYGITIGEVDYLNQRVLTSIQHTAARANDILWGMRAEDRQLIDVDRILTDGEE